MATATETVVDDEDEAPKVLTPEEKKAQADAERAKKLLEDPHKLWVKGQKLDVKIIRSSLAEDFGFGLYVDTLRFLCVEWVCRMGVGVHRVVEQWVWNGVGVQRIFYVE